MTIGELARAIHLSPGAATALVDRLEKAGLAVRRPDPTSRRRVLVTPTGEGAARYEALFEPLTREASKLLTGYGNESLTLIKGFVLGATRLLAEHAAVVRSRETGGRPPGGDGASTLAEP